MKQTLKHGKTIMKYTIVKSKRRKTSEIIIDDKIVIRTPIAKPLKEIKGIMEDKKQWIFKKQLEYSDRKKMRKFSTTTKTPEYLEKRTWKLASKIGVIPKKVVIKNLKSRWGSAGITGTITLNQALTKTPPRIIDYVIIHELCHLKIQGHSSRFWNLIRKFMPNFLENINWLEKNSTLVLD